MPLSDTKARNAKPRDKLYRIADAHGLCLEIRPTGHKVWRLRYRLDGKATMFTIGEYPAKTLAEARQQREWARSLIEQGMHPRAQQERERRRQRLEEGNTFRILAEEWYSSRSPHWSPNYCRQVRNGLEDDLYPAIGELPIRDIGAPDLLAIMRRVEKRGAPNVAILVRQWASSVFRFAITTLRAETDPAEYIKGAVKKPPVKHAVALSEKQLRFLLGQIELHGGYRVTQLAIELLMLTMVRTIEMRRAHWEHVDFESKVWRVPREDMKKQRYHAVPLSRQAMKALEELKTYSGGSGVLVPGMKHPNKPIHLTTINAALDRMGFGGGKFAAHGFRATASTLMNEHGWKEDAIERQLAHVPGDRTRGSYNHAQYMKERREMLQWWADYLDELRGQDACAH